MTLAQVVRKSHSTYVNVRPVLLAELRWKHGDALVAVVVDGDLILRKIHPDEIADAMRGAIYRRRDLVKKTPNAGSWSNPRAPKDTDAGS